jgi:hypothetical protein
VADERGTAGERAGMITFGDLETALRREIEVVGARFPNTDPGVVDRVVREVFAELRDDANVEAHLLAVTRNEAITRLEAQGQRFEPADLSGEVIDED